MNLRHIDSTPASDRLRADHRKIETHLDPLLYALKHLNAAAMDVIKENFRAIQEIAHLHFEQEELIFYPELRSLAPDLLAQMDKQHEEVRQTEQYLDDLLATLPASPGPRDWDELYRIGIEFHDAVQVHIVAEEDQLLKLADRELSSQQQEHLAAAMLQLASGKPASSSES